jgi:hypothetical protein
MADLIAEHGAPRIVLSYDNGAPVIGLAGKGESLRAPSAPLISAAMDDFGELHGADVLRRMVLLFGSGLTTAEELACTNAGLMVFSRLFLGAYADEKLAEALSDYEWAPQKPAKKQGTITAPDQITAEVIVLRRKVAKLEQQERERAMWLAICTHRAGHPRQDEAQKKLMLAIGFTVYRDEFPAAALPRLYFVVTGEGRKERLVSCSGI